MIVFLTLAYCAVLFVLVKVKVLKPTLFVKLSVVLWVLLLFVGLFIPMQFWAPSGNVLISQRITRMTAGVSGPVVKVHVKANEHVKKGAPLVTINATPYQAAVDGLKAQLAAAHQNVLALKAQLAAATAGVAEARAQREELKSALDAATSAVAQTRAQREALKTTLNGAVSSTDKAKAARDLANTTFLIAESVFKDDPGAISKLKYTQAQQSLAEAEAGVKVAAANEQTARVNYDSVAAATIQTAEANEQKARTAYEVEAVAAVQKAEANEQKARLAYESQINGVNTSVAEVQAQLVKAEYELGETTIYAPGDGFVTDLQVTEGSAFAVLAGNAMLNFVMDDEPDYVIAAIQEKNLRYIEPGQPTEVVLPLYPGETLTGKVDEVVWVTGEGQVMPQQPIPAVASRVKTGGEFAVKITLDPKWSGYRRPIGAGGIAAVYTDHGKPTHVIRKVMVRMTAWTNYVFQMPGQ